MQPNFFVDLRVRAAANSGPGALTALPVLTRLMSTLHGIMWRSDLRLALAFPLMREGVHRHPGNVVRAFGGSLADLESLTEQIRGNERLAPYVHCHFPRSIPKGFDGPWIEYRRFRVRSRGAGRDSARAEQIIQAEAFPYFRLKSKRTSQTFSLHIRRVEARVPKIRESFECTPDSYGLSSADAPFALPVVD